MSIEVACARCDWSKFYDDEDAAIADGWNIIDEEWYCPDCWTHCADCGEAITISDIQRKRNKFVCNECAKNYPLCSVCEVYKHKDEIKTVKDLSGLERKICQTCYELLERDGRIKDGILQEKYYEPVAQYIYPHKTTACPRCDNPIISRMGINYNCASCLETAKKNLKEEQTNLWICDTELASYHTDRHNDFKKTFLRTPDEAPYLHYGIELEYTLGERVNGNKSVDQVVREIIHETKGLFVAEQDSSLPGQSFELISRPISFKKWTEPETIELLNKAMEIINKYSTIEEQPKECGMHVHLSRLFFTKNTDKSSDKIITDMDWFFQVFQKEIEKLSRRKYTRYCTAKEYSVKQRIEDAGLEKYGVKTTFEMSPSRMRDDHYPAIGLRNHTIEIRTFKSTTKVEEILGTIELCRALSHAARNKKMDKNTTLEEIIYCKDCKYLPKLVKDTKVDVTKKYKQSIKIKVGE